MRQAIILAVVVREPHRVAGEGAVLPDRYKQTSAINEIWVTADNQILMELALDEAARPNPIPE